MQNNSWRPLSILFLSHLKIYLFQHSGWKWLHLIPISYSAVFQDFFYNLLDSWMETLQASTTNYSQKSYNKRGQHNTFHENRRSYSLFFWRMKCRVCLCTCIVYVLVCVFWGKRVVPTQGCGPLILQGGVLGAEGSSLLTKMKGWRRLIEEGETGSVSVQYGRWANIWVSVHINSYNTVLPIRILLGTI